MNKRKDDLGPADAAALPSTFPLSSSGEMIDGAFVAVDGESVTRGDGVVC